MGKSLFHGESNVGLGTLTFEIVGRKERTRFAGMALWNLCVYEKGGEFCARDVAFVSRV